MKVRAEFYSRLKEIAGASAIQLDLAEPATVSALWQELQRRYPAFQDFKTSVLFGCGVEFVLPEHSLREGDVIAIMPPVQGG